MLQHLTLKMPLVFSRGTGGVTEKTRKTGVGFQVKWVISIWLAEKRKNPGMNSVIQG